MASPPIVDGRRLLKKTATMYERTSTDMLAFTRCVPSSIRQRPTVMPYPTKYRHRLSSTRRRSAPLIAARTSPTSVPRRIRAISAQETTSLAAMRTRRETLPRPDPSAAPCLHGGPGGAAVSTPFRSVARLACLMPALRARPVSSRIPHEASLRCGRAGPGSPGPARPAPSAATAHRRQTAPSRRVPPGRPARV